MHSNYLTGSLPSEIGNLTMLNYLYLGDNNLTGVLPQEVGRLKHLEVLDVAYNNLIGRVQPWLFNMSELRELALSATGMVGPLPSTTGYGLPHIEMLLLDQNSLTGEIPQSLFNCSTLRTLVLSANQFTGFISHSLGSLRLIERLSLGSNNLRIEPHSSELRFMDSLANCRFLTQLTIYSNPLYGAIPASIGNLSTSLQKFIAFNCKIKGVIPAEIGNLTNLVSLRLDVNELVGKIPFVVEHFHELQGLYLQNNNIEGFISNALCSLRSLVELNLSQNQFSGPIPECLGNVTSLRFLFLDSNMITSSIPSSLWRLTDLLKINFSSNSLSGFLAPEIGKLVRLDFLDLSRNKFSEQIPSTIGQLKGLSTLSLGHNELNGSIPMSMGGMINLEILDLSYNKLSGSIPQSLEALKLLEFFNVSFNSLTGEIPSGGPFRNFTMESFRGNEALCGIARFHVPLCHAISKHGSRMKRVRLALFVSAGVIISIMVFSLAFILQYRRKAKTENKEDGLVPPTFERISYYELLRATEQFSEGNLLGMGGFGSVYKGTLRDGKVLAIKVFNFQAAAFKSFEVECEVLRSIRHRNLNKVLGSCSNEDFKALILEYMPNGNLVQWLYSHNNYMDVAQRLNIMIDVALALEYLHDGCSTPIVHCDLKPSNVLLDEDMTARVSDFGMAKLLGDGNSTTITNTLATLGYIAPEYGLEGLVSTRCDVFSYGIMLMEVFTGKRPNDEMFQGDLSLKSWIVGLLPESLDQIIDANLLNPERRNLDKILQCVLSILELALKCSAEYPRDRMNIKDALAELQKIKCRLLA